jgi:orotate phosphoribosyltransferase-like protein
MKSILINNIVDSVLLKYKEGQEFFSNLDFSFRNKKVIDILLASCPAKYKIITSGSFGKKMKQIFPHKVDLLLPGDLRHKPKYDLSSQRKKIKKQDYIFLDDSYYSGRTVNVVRKAIEEQQGNLVKTYVIYDGKKNKDKDIEYFYRYFDNHF